jgi:hypothetical protein
MENQMIANYSSYVLQQVDAHSSLPRKYLIEARGNKGPIHVMRKIQGNIIYILYNAHFMMTECFYIRLFACLSSIHIISNPGTPLIIHMTTMPIFSTQSK